MDEDVTQVDASGADELAEASDDAEIVAADKKGKDGDNIIAILIG